MNIDTEPSNSYQYKSKQNKYNSYHQNNNSNSNSNSNSNPNGNNNSHHNHPPPHHKYNGGNNTKPQSSPNKHQSNYYDNGNSNNDVSKSSSSNSSASARPHSHSHPMSRNGSGKSSSSGHGHRHQHRSSKSREQKYTNLNGKGGSTQSYNNYNGSSHSHSSSHQPHPHGHSNYHNNHLYKSHKERKQRPNSSSHSHSSHHSHSNRSHNGHNNSNYHPSSRTHSSHSYQSSRNSNGSNHRNYNSYKRQTQQQDNTINNVKGSQHSPVDIDQDIDSPMNNNKHSPDSDILDLTHQQKQTGPNMSDFVMMVDKNNHHNMHNGNGMKKNNVSSQTTKTTTTVDDEMTTKKEKEAEQKQNGYVEHVNIHHDRERDVVDDDDSDDEHDASSSSSDSEFEQAYPLRVIAFDLDKTMVRTISLHTNEQPQPEQHPGGYFMFFDDDTKEYHHVYKRPHLKELLDFLYHAIVSTNKCKMMLCTHGTQKYAQTILERCNADKLFPLMLPRRDWCRRKFEDDYKPRRFKTIEKMAVSVNERVEDVIMIDDDPGVYSKGDRCNGSLVHIKPFDDPYEQRDDTELPKLIKLLSHVLKYGKNYYNKVFANSIRYTGLVKTYMNPQQMAQHSLFRAELLKRLIFDFGIKMNKQERLGTVYLFDRYTANQQIDWNLLDKHKNNFTFYVILIFGCLFVARQYLYTDTKRPKQFRRDPYSAEIWLIHVEIYEKIVKKYKTMNGISLYNQASSQESGKHHKHNHRHSRNKHSNSHRPTDQQQKEQILNEMKVNDPNNNNNNNNNINNVNNNSNGNEKNSWLPSFFVFGNNKNGNANNNNSNGNLNNNNNAFSNTSIQDMEMGSSPPLQPLANMMIPQQIQNPEEKSNILIDDDDDDVLQWQNDYGRDHNPLYQNPELLKTKGMIGEGKFVPNEKRQCGWILQNKSNVYLKLQAKLQCIGGDKEQHGMRISTEKLYEFSLKPNEEVYILIEVSAPSMPGKYCAFYQLVIDNQVKIGEMLEIMCEVQSQFSDKKEQKIAQIIKMGFDDRKKVIATLQKNKWNVQQSIDKLIGL